MWLWSEHWENKILITLPKLALEARECKDPITLIFDFCQFKLLTFYISDVICIMLDVLCHMSHIICHMLQGGGGKLFVLRMDTVTCHISHVTCYMLQGGWGKSFLFSGWTLALSGMNSLLAPGLHPFSPHFSAQKSGKPETFSVNLQTVEIWENFVRRHDLGKTSLGDLSWLLCALVPQLIMEDDRGWGLRLVLKWRLEHL